MISWIRIRTRNDLQMTSENVWKMSLFEPFFKVSSLYMEAKIRNPEPHQSERLDPDPHQSECRIRIRISDKQDPIRIKATIRIRIRIKVMRIRNTSSQDCLILTTGV